MSTYTLTLRILLSKTFSFLSEHKPLFSKIILIFTGCNFFIMAGYFAYNVETAKGSVILSYSMLSTLQALFALNVIQYFIGIYLSACLMHFLFNANSQTTLKSFLSWNKEKLFFSLRFILITLIIPLLWVGIPCGLILVLVPAPFKSIFWPVLLISVLTYAMFYMRLTLILPATFTQTPLSIKESLSISKDSMLMLFSALIFITLLFSILSFVSEQFFAGLEQLLFHNIFLTTDKLAYTQIDKMFSLTFPHFLVVMIGYLVSTAIQALKFCTLTIFIACAFCEINNYTSSGVASGISKNN